MRLVLLQLLARDLRLVVPVVAAPVAQRGGILRLLTASAKRALDVMTHFFADTENFALQVSVV
jgi:hypothetical protein